MATTAQIRWKQTNKLCGQCQTWQQHSDRLATLVWVLFFLLWGSGKGSHDTNTQTPHSTAHIFNGFGFETEEHRIEIFECALAQNSKHTHAHNFILHTNRAQYVLYIIKWNRKMKRTMLWNACVLKLYIPAHTHTLQKTTLTLRNCILYTNKRRWCAGEREATEPFALRLWSWKCLVDMVWACEHVKTSSHSMRCPWNFYCFLKI